MVRLLRFLPLLAFATSVAAAAQPASDSAGTTMAAFTAVAPVAAAEEDSHSALHCTAERDLCAQAWRDAEYGRWFLYLHNGMPATPDAEPARRLPLPEGEDPERGSYAIWPNLVREAAGALLIGVEGYRRIGFSGGGAGATQLVLLRLAPGADEATEVLSVQTGYTTMIRACFSQADYRRLRDACHQELEYEARLTLAPEPAAGRPRFAFTATARVFPRGSLVEGWEYRSYRRADLVWENDPNCSYGRSFAYDAATGRYAPDQPLPDCSLYSLP